MRFTVKEEPWKRIKEIAFFMGVAPEHLLSEMIRNQIRFAMDELDFTKKHPEFDDHSALEELKEYYWELYDPENKIQPVIQN